MFYLQSKALVPSVSCVITSLCKGIILRPIIITTMIIFICYVGFIIICFMLQDGIFLVRFSTRDVAIHPYTLMVVLHQTVQHIPIYVRTHRSCKFALGSEKPDEQVGNSF